MRRSFDLALQHTQQSVERNPTNQWNQADMGIVLVNIGQAEEALARFKRAKEIDPYFDPPWYWRWLGQAHMVLHQYQAALAMFDRLPARQYRVVALAAGCHARLGEMDRAAACVAECMAMKPDFSVALFMRKQSFKNAVDTTRLAESLRLAGLPD
jgi:adenylate cyclase